jgi:hypothetical protein
MNDNKEQLKNFIGGVRVLKMTEAEKEAIKTRLIDHIRSADGSVASPYSRVGPIFMSRQVSYVLAGALVVLLTMSSTAYAAEGALPGDLLYPAKVKVVEPLEGALSFGAQAKAEWSEGVAIERLDEAHMLASEGRLDATTSAELAQSFASSSEAFDRADISLRSENVDEASSSEDAFKADIRAHAQIFADMRAADTSSTKNQGLAVIEKTITARTDDGSARTATHATASEKIAEKDSHQPTAVSVAESASVSVPVSISHESVAAASTPSAHSSPNHSESPAAAAHTIAAPAENAAHGILGEIRKEK